MIHIISTLLTLALAAGAAPQAKSGQDVGVDEPTVRAEYGLLTAPDDGRGTPYIVNKSDNICGLDEPRQLTNPAKVDYEALLEATAEVKKIKKDKIDPKSSEGITLMTKARKRVLKACEAVRAADGYCSVWKDIKRRDKRAIDDITDAVKRKL